MVRVALPSARRFGRPLRFVRRQLPPLNFITIHYIYFLLTCLLSALIFWGSSTPFRSVSFTDSLFLTVSAMTLAGLNTVNLSALNTFQQFLLFLLIMLGSAIFVSAFVVHVRRTAFNKKFVDVERRETRIRRVKTWAGDHWRTRSRERGRDEAVLEPSDPKDDQIERRDSTPPARRGGPEMNRTNSGLDASSPDRSRNQGITFSADTRSAPLGARTATGSQGSRPLHRVGSNLFSMQGVGARPMSSLRTSTSVELQQPPISRRVEDSRQAKPSRKDINRYFDSATGWISRNSQFHGLTEEERERLGGCEYRAVALLAWLVPAYFVLWQLIGCIGCAAWVALNMPGTARSNGLNPWWVGAFNAVSAFNNSGMSLLDANMVAFQRSYYLLLTMGLLILAGNTCYPIFLRLTVWCMLRIATRFARSKSAHDPWAMRVQTLNFLLDHPRRCYTNLFPSQHTWWLALSVFILNGVDWAFFEILNIGNHEITDGLPTKYRVIDGLFQAFAVRSGGFYVVTISSLRIALQVLYVVMMYISVYPVVITLRNSNVYEERSLGIYADDEEHDGAAERATEEVNFQPGLLGRAKTIGNRFITGGAAAASHESNGHFVRQQLRAQLAHDAWVIVLALFLIMIIEGDKFRENPSVYSVFNFIFEIVSAYGCVGISVGVPWAAYSFCGAWSTLSKLILCVVMLRGRHRGLPVAIDKAVLLPSEHHGDAEEQDGRIRMARTLSRARNENTVI